MIKLLQLLAISISDKKDQINMLGPNSGNLNDQILSNYIDTMFDKYDTDKSGDLDQEEMFYLFTDLFQKLNIKKPLTHQQVKQAMIQMDTDKSGKIQKQQLFVAFKELLLKINLRQNQQKMRQQYFEQNYRNPNIPPMSPFYNPHLQQGNPAYFQPGPYQYNNMFYNQNMKGYNMNNQNYGHNWAHNSMNLQQKGSNNDQNNKNQTQSNYNRVDVNQMSSSVKFGGGWSKRRI